MNIGNLIQLQPTLKETYKSSKGNIFECFLGNPRDYTIEEFSRKDISSCKNKQMMYVHLPYVFHLGSPKEFVREESLQVLLDTLDTIRNLNSKVIVHTGSGSVEAFVEQINLIPNNKLLIENNSGGGNQIGGSWKNIRKIWEGIDKQIPMCFSTNKAYSAGMCPFRKHTDIEKVFSKIESLTGKIPELIHLNDSGTEFGSKIDRYKDLGTGYIFQKEKRSYDIISEILEYNIDIICQTYTSKINLDYLTLSQLK